jgi:DNA-binding transcriptional MerR regulator
VPPARRSESGYRHFGSADVRRLRLLRRLRVLGMPLSQIRPLVERAMSADCADFATELSAVFEQQRREIDRRMAELAALRDDLDGLAKHLEHCACEPGQLMSDCDCCDILNEEGGACDERCS